jgi:hypothetical protein
MNQNDSERYFWRTSLPWSGHNRLARKFSRSLRLRGRGIFFICLAFIVTIAGLMLKR